MVGRTDPSNSDNLNGYGGGWVYACARVCPCVRWCVRACVHVCVREEFEIHYMIIIFDPG